MVYLYLKLLIDLIFRLHEAAGSLKPVLFVKKGQHLTDELKDEVFFGTNFLLEFVFRLCAAAGSQKPVIFV